MQIHLLCSKKFNKKVKFRLSVGLECQISRNASMEKIVLIAVILASFGAYHGAFGKELTNLDDQELEQVEEYNKLLAVYRANSS